jgi:hypothetical protein
MGSSYKRTLTRRQRSQVKFGNIREVFRTHRKNPFDAHLARLCVLYEDLRMEIEGIRARNVPKLDVLDPRRDHLDHPERMGSYRRHYFLRRLLLHGANLRSASVNCESALNFKRYSTMPTDCLYADSVATPRARPRCRGGCWDTSARIPCSWLSLPNGPCEIFQMRYRSLPIESIRAPAERSRRQSGDHARSSNPCRRIESPNSVQST